MQLIQLIIYKMMMINKMYKSTTILICNTLDLLGRIRYFSTVKDPYLQLLSIIVYNILYEYEADEENLDQKIVNREILLSGRYVLSPLYVVFLKTRDMSMFSDFYMDYYNCFLPVPNFICTTNPHIKLAVLPTKEDTFLLMGLSRLLLRLTGRPQRLGKMLNEFSFMEVELYKNLRIKEPVDRLYKLDLKSSEDVISNSMILERVAPLLGEGSAIYNLISSFLNLNIVDNDFESKIKYPDPYCYKVDISMLSKLLLPLGDITRVLFHIVLMDLDREFQKRFSSIRYYRLLDEVYILTHSNNKDVIFDEKAGYALLEELGLSGKIESIRPGDAPLPCRRSWCDDTYYTHSVYLDYDKSVRVFSDRKYRQPKDNF